MLTPKDLDKKELIVAYLKQVPKNKETLKHDWRAKTRIAKETSLHPYKSEQMLEYLEAEGVVERNREVMAITLFRLKT